MPVLFKPGPVGKRVEPPQIAKSQSHEPAESVQQKGLLDNSLHKARPKIAKKRNPPSRLKQATNATQPDSGYCEVTGFSFGRKDPPKDSRDVKSSSLKSSVKKSETPKDDDCCSSDDPLSAPPPMPDKIETKRGDMDDLFGDDSADEMDQLVF